MDTANMFGHGTQTYQKPQSALPAVSFGVFSDGMMITRMFCPMFCAWLIDYGQLIKIKKHGRLVGKEKIVVYGEPVLGDIEPTEVENFNSILRERLGRLVRKSKCFSKVKRRLVCAVELFRFYWNFINEFKRGFSPAKIEGLTDHLWTWHEFYYHR
jgi:hypothetical protein